MTFAVPPCLSIPNAGVGSSFLKGAAGMRREDALPWMVCFLRTARSLAFNDIRKNGNQVRRIVIFFCWATVAFCSVHHCTLMPLPLLSRLLREPASLAWFECGSYTMTPLSLRLTTLNGSLLYSGVRSIWDAAHRSQHYLSGCWVLYCAVPGSLFSRRLPVLVAFLVHLFVLAAAAVTPVFASTAGATS